MWAAAADGGVAWTHGKKMDAEKHWWGDPDSLDTTCMGYKAENAPSSCPRQQRHLRQAWRHNCHGGWFRTQGAGSALLYSCPFRIVTRLSFCCSRILCSPVLPALRLTCARKRVRKPQRDWSAGGLRSRPTRFSCNRSLSKTRTPACTGLKVRCHCHCRCWHHTSASVPRSTAPAGGVRCGHAVPSQVAARSMKTARGIKCIQQIPL